MGPASSVPSSSPDSRSTATRPTTNLLAAEKVAGVGHHVALSVVGTDHLPSSGYLRAKVAQEELIRHGGVPWSIVHATRSYELTGAIAQAATVGDPLGGPADRRAGQGADERLRRRSAGADG